ncbi:DUF6716 putative glycosyltransferase [Curtobacterium sp. MCBA15_001]|uniref:DUF6716 putative glycosyltransferase n=1 Tax=Curtobacterium sp. MCBA15_001 TaxID=1898731 RepID=UPI0008DE535A|nr:DUF6716 putative glycosyltransferase [Curtobacterium sp. MCBA15_001]OIH97213.1 hypothetical protein BIU90_14860 [Curtobacterium sp. MCBA15_001]
MVGIVDTDSFAKWGAHLLSAAPAAWSLELLVVATPRTASPGQLRAAFRGLDERLAHLSATPPAPLDVDAIVERLRVDPPDAVLVSTIGPVAELLIDEVHRRVTPRPVLMTGLPGISFPSKWKGVFSRARADLFVLHSHREVRAYDALATENGVTPFFALATLPFAVSSSSSSNPNAAPGQDPRSPAPDSVVFAAQPSVPASEHDRAQVVAWLAETARRHPTWRVVVKTRAVAGEHQTHRETFAYADLVPEDAPPNLVVETGPMAAHLDRAVALVTISSTAVLEAAARGIPALTLTDFGVARSLINEVFVDSGLEGDAVDLVDGRFGTVRAAWMTDNYFHAGSDDDWVRRTESLMQHRDAGALVDRPAARTSRGGALRRAWERKNALGSADRSALGTVAFAIGAPIRTVKRSARWFGRLVAPRPHPRAGEMPASVGAPTTAFRPLAESPLTGSSPAGSPPAESPPAGSPPTSASGRNASVRRGTHHGISPARLNGGDRTRSGDGTGHGTRGEVGGVDVAVGPAPAGVKPDRRSTGPAGTGLQAGTSVDGARDGQQQLVAGRDAG